MDVLPIKRDTQCIVTDVIDLVQEGMEGKDFAALSIQIRNRSVIETNYVRPVSSWEISHGAFS